MSHFYSAISLRGEQRSMLRLLLLKGAATILLRVSDRKEFALKQGAAIIT